MKKGNFPTFEYGDYRDMDTSMGMSKDLFEIIYLIYTENKSR